MSRPALTHIFALLLVTSTCTAQVIDVDGDSKVGPHEALALALQWRKDASKSDNDHSHMGQTWSLHNNPLTIWGSSTTGALVLDNTIGPGDGGSIKRFGAYIRSAGGVAILAEGGDDTKPDIVLRGAAENNDNGVLSSDMEDVDSDLVLMTKDIFEIRLDGDNNDTSLFQVRNGTGNIIYQLNESGTMNIAGEYQSTLKTTRLDHPLDPSGKYLNHFSVDSPQPLNIYNGNVTLDDKGEAVVELPDYFEAYNTDYRYQLTCIGGFAPVFVAEEIHDGHFKIGGGKADMKVSWEVSGVRQDPYLKAHPVSAEEDKLEEEKGRYLNPELYGQPAEKSLMVGMEP